AGRARAGGAAARRSGDWQVAPGPGAASTGGRRAPSTTDAVPVFAVLPEYPLLSDGGSARAGRTALCAGRDPAAEAAQVGRMPRAVWPAAGGGGPPLCDPPLAPAARCLCAPDCIARAAEAADAARPPDAASPHRYTATSALGHGRPALGRSVDAGGAQSPGRSTPRRLPPGGVDLSAGFQPTVDGAHAPHPGDAAALGATGGDRDDWPSGAWQGPPSRGR